ncbi:MAG: hypothetical protein RJA59_1841 [Pseudomonadota bacterium]|jgi:hypothetical protein
MTVPDDKKPQQTESPKPPPKPPPSWEEHIRSIVQADIAGPQDTFARLGLKRRHRP